MGQTVSEQKWFIVTAGTVQKAGDLLSVKLRNTHPGQPLYDERMQRSQEFNAKTQMMAPPDARANRFQGRDRDRQVRAVGHVQAGRDAASTGRQIDEVGGDLAHGGATDGGLQPDRDAQRAAPVPLRFDTLDGHRRGPASCPIMSRTIGETS
jgi:hypothetical protein